MEDHGDLLFISGAALYLPGATPGRIFASEAHMIVVREIFQIKFGRMKEAKELWKEMIKLTPADNKPRVLTDLTGPYYTLELENTYKDLATFEAGLQKEMSGPDFATWYQKFTPLVDSGRREIFTIV